MEYLKIDGHFPRLKASAVTLGKFDGVHRGHRRLIQEVTAQKENGLLAVLFAFQTKNAMLFSDEERKRLLESLGVDVLLECPLNEQIRHMRAENFVQDILVGRLRASHIVVGEDFRFGYERKGNADLLEQMGQRLGFTVQVLPKEMDGRRKISSTYLREELQRGNMEKYAFLAGMPFVVEGYVAHGRGLGHRHLLPTTNLIPDGAKLMPPNGVYVTRSYFGERCYQGITNIGYKPTVGEKFLGVETYLFDCSEDLYDQFCRVEFLHFSRPEQKFPTLDALRRQLLSDAENGKVYFDNLR